MTRLQAVQFTRQKLDEYGLTTWKVRLSTSDAGMYLGMCSHRDKTIILNAHHIDIHPDEEVKDTILHEVAHALTPGMGHNDIWANKAREIGCTNTLPCSHLSFPPHVIDAIRSGATLEVDFEEQVIRTPKYKITQLKDVCPECGAVAKELFSFDTVDKDGNDVKMITLACYHIIKKVKPKGTPFEKLVSNGWKKEIADCKHEWNQDSNGNPIKAGLPRNVCLKCGEYKLYDFQVEGARFIESAISVAKGGGVMDEMGLGKTVQALSYIYFHPERLPVLYVNKSGVKFQWFKEIIRWLGPDYLPQIISTSKDYVYPNLKSYIISYDLLRRFPREKIEALGIKTVVLDECQQIKNPDSARTREVRQLVKGADVKVIPLSGTPWKNRGSEFFPALNMLDPQKFYSYQGYIDRWVDYYYHGAAKKEGGIKNPEAFKEYIKHIVIRRERKDVMKELPLISRTKLYVQLEKTEEEIYDEEVKKFVDWYNSFVMEGREESIDGLQMLAKMSRMRHLTGLAKIPATVNYVEEFIEEREGKIVIFVHHKDVGELLVDEFKKRYVNQGPDFIEDIPVMRLEGGTDSGVRFEIQEKFNNSKRAILVASTLAAGEGLNLQTCDTCVMHERQWNPANEEQAEGRFIRIGQQSETVTARYVQVEGSIDEHLDAIVENKRLQFHKVMNTGEAPTWNEAELGKQLAEMIKANYDKKNKGKRNRKRA